MWVGEVYLPDELGGRAGLLLGHEVLGLAHLAVVPDVAALVARLHEGGAGGVRAHVLTVAAAVADGVGR